MRWITRVFGVVNWKYNRRGRQRVREKEIALSGPADGWSSWWWMSMFLFHVTEFGFVSISVYSFEYPKFTGISTWVRDSNCCGYVPYCHRPSSSKCRFILWPISPSICSTERNSNRIDHDWSVLLEAKIGWWMAAGKRTKNLKGFVHSKWCDSLFSV